MPGPKHFMIVAGEASGDMHAAHLVREIKKLEPSARFSGLGGPQLAAEGVKLYADLTKIAVIGFFEVLKHYPLFKRYFALFLKEAAEQKPDAVILVDYPGFNLRLAKALKKKNIKIFYYISPQVWAWKEKRVDDIKKYVDRMFVFFEFEKKLYARHGLDVTWAGHPLVDSVRVSKDRGSILKGHGLNEQTLTIGLLPGSRPKEIQTLLPVMLNAARVLAKEHPQIQLLLIKAPSIERLMLEKIVKEHALPLAIAENDIYDSMSACDVCIAASGTATLELAILNKPMVIVYKTSLATWLLAKLLIKIPNIGLVNVVAGKQVVPECIQFEATGEKIAAATERLLNDPEKIAGIQNELLAVKTSLGQPGASQRVAQEMINA